MTVADAHDDVPSVLPEGEYDTISVVDALLLGDPKLMTDDPVSQSHKVLRLRGAVYLVVGTAKAAFVVLAADLVDAVGSCSSTTKRPASWASSSVEGVLVASVINVSAR